MLYAITGNASKNDLWQPAAELIGLLQKRQPGFLRHPEVANGLLSRGLIDASVCEKSANASIHEADMVLSFGGDGTIIRSAHQIAPHGTPLLGVNIGRLGFLADIEVRALEKTLDALESGQFELDRRIMLEVSGPPPVDGPRWALNEYVISKKGLDSMIRIHTRVNGRYLNTYWADGLIVSTPTGSTAYSLAVGGPILMPGCGSLVLTPIAPHMLTLRSMIVPDHVTISIEVEAKQNAFVFSNDGMNVEFPLSARPLVIKRSKHTVNLVSLEEQDYFATLRSKLGWGAGFKMADTNQKDDELID